MRSLFLSLISLSFAQKSLLVQADSLREERLYKEALEGYRRFLLHSEGVDTLRLKALMGGIDCLLAIGNFPEADHWIGEGESLTVRLSEPIYQNGFRQRKGRLLYLQGRYTEAEKLYAEVISTWERLVGKTHPDYATALNNMAILYRSQGRYKEAEKLFSEILPIYEMNFGIYHPFYLNALGNVAAFYQSQGRYAEAERLFLEIKELKDKIMDTEDPDYATMLNNLALLHAEQGRYAQAEKLYIEALEQYKKLVGSSHPDYARALNNLAALYYYQKRLIEAESLYTEAAHIYENSVGKSHPSYIRTQSNIAVLYRAKGEYQRSERIFLEIREWQEKKLGTQHSDYATTLHNLGSVYRGEGRYTEAIQLLQQALRLREAVLGPNHPTCLHSLEGLASSYAESGRYQEADSLWPVIIQRAFYRIRRDFAALPTVHREKLIETILQSYFSGFQRYVVERGRENPVLLSLGYRTARSTKGLILTSIEAMRHLVEASSDTALRTLYAQWRDLMDQYAFWAAQGRYTKADSVWELAVHIEQRLGERLPSLGEFLPDPFQENIYPPLRKGEALVEVIRLRDKKDSILYLYYVLIPHRKGIRLQLQIHHVDSLWEIQARRAYELSHSPGGMSSGIPYVKLWRFIDSLLPRHTKKLYFSPDGIYYLINLGSLYIADERRFVTDKYGVRYVASSRRLLRKRRYSAVSPPVVVGNPDFGEGEEPIRQGRVRSTRLFVYGIPPLPGAEAEARAIASILGVEAVVGKAATEKWIKSLRSPRVLHIATHGFFSPEGGSSMGGAGLLLAQAAVWDSLYPEVGREDGRITAQEAAVLNLLGTELVVLSACETGLGEVRGEGLYGLQRAFLEAGASRVMTTLWSIDDEATRQLMEAFYRQWLTKRNKDKPVEDVLGEVIRAFRRKYPHPYYWGAFTVMQ
ncbi:MAG: CHAT domain-containing protein [Bacteroidia bacterium]|nr:CHAT domain-containing protein [Bacteroidia bacterium]